MADSNGKTNPKYFTLDDTWTGGFYELALEIGPYADKPLFDALKVLWKHPSLEGCYLDQTKEPDDQVRYNPVAELYYQQGMYSDFHTYSISTLPNGSRIACGSCIIREYFAGSDADEDAPDWLVFYLPMGALAQTYDVGGYPFDTDIKSPESWQKPIDDYLAELGKYIYAHAPSRLGLIGHEVSGTHYADEITEQGISDERYIGYLLPQNGTLNYFPRNEP